jgi:outer membrane protein TolC
VLTERGVPRRVWRPWSAGSLVLAASFVFGSAWAQPPPRLSPVASPTPPPPTAEGAPLRLSLSEAVALGVRDNRTIKSAYLARAAQRFDLVVARSQFLPHINLVAGVSRDTTGGIRTTSTTLAPTGTWLLPTGATVQFAWSQGSTAAGGAPGVLESTSVNVTQPLLRGAGLAVNAAPVRIAALQEQINKLALKTTVSDTVTQIVLAYRALVQAQEAVRLAQAALDRSQALLDTNQALISAGRMAAADLLQTKADFANERVSVLQAEQQRASAQLALLQMLAVDLRTNVVAADPIDANRTEIDLERVVALALDNRMDVLAQRKTLEQDRETLRVARSGRLWDLSVVAGASRDRVSGAAAAFLPQSNSTVGLQLSIPIGDFTLKQAEIHASTNLRVDEVKLEDLRQTAEAQVRDAVQQVDGAWAQLAAAREAQALAAQALKFENDKLKAGRASNFEVLSFEANLKTAEVQALNAGIAYLNALTSFDEQVGGTLATWRIELND